MKLSIEKDIFLKALQKIQSVVSNNPVQVIFNNVLLECENDKLFLTTTDGFITIKCVVDADIKKKGKTTIPARRLFSIVREFSQQQINIEADEKNVVHIESGASSYRLFGFSPEDFPSLSDLSETKGFVIGQNSFKQMLSKTVYAVSTDEHRLVLNGVYLSVKDQKISVVATDARRLALIEQELEIPVDFENKAILPTKAVNELIKSLDDEGDVRIQIEDKMAIFTTNDMKLVTKLVDGEYPNYQHVIPSHCDERITVDRESLLATLRRASLLTSDSVPSVKTCFGENQILISSVDPEVGESHEAIPVKYSGKNIVGAFNPEFFMDPLRVLTSDEIFLEIIGEATFLVVKCDIPFLYVLMPLRLET